MTMLAVSCYAIHKLHITVSGLDTFVTKLVINLFNKINEWFFLLFSNLKF